MKNTTRKPETLEEAQTCIAFAEVGIECPICQTSKRVKMQKCESPRKMTWEEAQICATLSEAGIDCPPLA